MEQLPPRTATSRRKPRPDADSTLCSPFDASVGEELAFELSVAASPIPRAAGSTKMRLFTGTVELDESVWQGTPHTAILTDQQKHDLWEGETQFNETARTGDEGRNLSLELALAEKDKALGDLCAENEDQQKHIRSLLTRIAQLGAQNSALESQLRSKEIPDRHKFEKELRVLKLQIRKQEKDIEYFQSETVALKSKNTELISRLRTQAIELQQRSIDRALGQFDAPRVFAGGLKGEEIPRTPLSLCRIQIFYRFKFEGRNRVLSSLRSLSFPPRRRAKEIQRLPALFHKDKMQLSPPAFPLVSVATSIIAGRLERLFAYCEGAFAVLYQKFSNLHHLVDQGMARFWLLEKQNVRLSSRIISLELLLPTEQTNIKPSLLYSVPHKI